MHSLFRKEDLTGKGFGGRTILAGRPRLASKKPGVVSAALMVRGGIASSDSRGHNSVMRALAMVVAAAAILFGVYEYYLKRMPTAEQGTASTQAISLTGVRGDLLQIGQAERAYIALNGHCASLEELLSSNSLTMSRPERDGYSYAVECSGGSFAATARHAPAAAGSPIRYPSFAIDQTMQVHEVN
jgi:hypothetical protein